MFDYKAKIQSIPPLVRNKYFLVALFVSVWMLFFDDNNFINQWKLLSKMKDLAEKKNYFITEIEKTYTELNELTTNPETQEKFAREKYHMKRDNEDVFIIVAPQKKTN
jgi:cell division protein FtsB